MNRDGSRSVPPSYWVRIERMAPPWRVERSGSEPLTRCWGNSIVIVGGGSWNRVRMSTRVVESKVRIMRVVDVAEGSAVSAQKPRAGAMSHRPAVSPTTARRTRVDIRGSQEFDAIVDVDVLG